MHIADLKDQGRGTWAVGWLHPEHPFRQGSPPPMFVERLNEFLDASFRRLHSLACKSAANSG